MAMRVTANLAVAGACLGLAVGVPAFAVQVFAAQAFAAQVDTGGQAEWRQSYEAATNLAVPRSLVPMLSSDSAAATEAAIARYQQIAARGGWGTLPTNLHLKLGARGKGVIALRQRLLASGDLDQADNVSDTYDSFTEAGVRRFQTRHGLGVTGVVGDQTIAAMNVAVETRIQQLEVNLVRLRSFSGFLGQRYVVTNIPAAQVETVENGQVVTRHAAGVGKIDRQSPIMTTKAVDINFNPFWTVPVSIIKKDLIPRMRKDMNYLSEEKIRIYNGQGQEVQATQVNWNSEDATHFTFRQDPGADVNSLGTVRINIANPYGVYMHDTPEKGIFGDDYRFVSSGCVRVQNVRDYITWLLKDTPGWTRDKIDEAIASGQRIDVKLAQPVPVYWVYLTSWATPDGIVNFRDDIYQKDGIQGVPVATADAE
ncbi:Putative peptidoglycan binding domain-containing protein [Rhizobiales bacterium GAS113]|nr:Putative peptidoglycan binding domain-containing protein [Rhizobiales bacterium GAS113]